MSRIRWHLTAAAIAAAAVTFGIVAAPASGAASPTAEFQKTQDWGSGWTGKVTVRNGGSSALSSWAVEFDLPAGTSIPSAWDAALTKTGNHYKFTNLSWNGSVPAGGTASFGFNGSGPGSPSNCTLNGQACGGGTNPTSTTTTTTTTTTKPTSSTTTTTSSSTTTTTSSSTTTTTTTGNPPPGDKLVGYFIQWGVYGRNFHVKNVDTSGSAAKLTHINYAFGNVQNGQCTIGDAYADYDKAYTAADSVDGVADNWDQPLRGNFNQLRKLKKKYPNLKVLWSFGGWTWSGGFGQASKNPAAFADSCYKLVEDPRWADVFDGIDIDWEYPNACGLTCDTSGPDSFKAVTQALRNKFGANNLITAATSADGADGGKLDVADYAGAVQYLDWVMPMTYDFFGAWDAKGPTNPHSPLTAYPGIPKDKWTTEGAINKFKSKGIPASKILLGVGFYGRGWTGVTQATPGGTATAAAPGTYEAGFEDYKVLKTKCPATGTIGGTAYAFCGGNWWGYDTPATVAGKRNWGKAQGLGGSFFWELSGDTSNGELITALRG